MIRAPVLTRYPSSLPYRVYFTLVMRVDDGTRDRPPQAVGFRHISHAERGLLIGNIIGPIYCLARSFELQLNIPIVGSTDGLPAPFRIICALFVGTYYGAAFGNRLGECLDCLLTRAPLNNRDFLSRTVPFVTGAAAVLLLAGFDRYGGKPIFDPVNKISAGEMYGFTFLYGAYIGASLAAREGRLLDLWTSNRLVADCGTVKCCRGLFSRNAHPHNRVGDEANNSSAPLIIEMGIGHQHDVDLGHLHQ